MEWSQRRFLMRKMMRSTISKFPLLITLAAMALTAGCASVPAPQSAQDCLVAVPVRFDADPGVKIVREYRIVLNGDLGDYRLPQRYSGYVLVRLNGAAAQIVEITSKVNEEGYSGASGQTAINISLPYEPGAILILDRAFVLRAYSISQRTSRTSWDFEPLEDEFRDEIVEELRKLDGIDAWRFDG
jgi:hypothetical protein